MAGVEFDSENQASVLYSRWQTSDDTPKMVQMLMGWGLVKNREQANIILICIAICAFGLSVYFFFFSGPRPASLNPASLPGTTIPGGAVLNQAK